MYLLNRVKCLYKSLCALPRPLIASPPSAKRMLLACGGGRGGGGGGKRSVEIFVKSLGTDKIAWSRGASEL